MHVYVFSGQGGLLFSAGFKSFEQTLQRAGYETSWWTDSHPQAAINHMTLQPKDKLLACVGYSLGVNRLTWALGGYNDGRGNKFYGMDQLHPTRMFELVVAYDGTVNALMSPIYGNVRRAICYHQTARWFPTSFGFGRAALSSAPGGPPIEIHQVRMDHLYVQSSPRLHAITLEALNQARHVR
jgi:hypothetical protein